jgi:outer membrane murein-binding lipoprotein Lpp
VANSGADNLKTFILHGVSMKTIASKWHLWVLMLLLLASTPPTKATAPTPLFQGSLATSAVPAQKDSVGRARLTSVDEMARRVDSLQFIVVYNADLLRRDLDAKVIWIYVMLGVMIVASMMMYGALNQAQRQRKDLEERVFNTLSSSVIELEEKIKRVESEIKAPGGARRTKPAGKKKSI